MQTEYPVLRTYLNPNLASLPDARLRTTLRMQSVDAESMEGFFDDLGKFAAKAAPTILPLAGQVVGGIYGGPAGAAIGGSLGNLAGGAISNLAGGGKPAASSAAPSPTPMSVPRGVAPLGMGAPPAAPSGASPAAGQLLQTIMRPETMQALASMMMGAMGKQNVSVGGTQVPVTAFTNLLGSLAGRTEAEFNARSAMQESSLPYYLQDFAGEATVDPASSNQRASALYRLLEASEASFEGAESTEGAEWGEAYEAYGESEAIESEAEAAEFLEAALEGFESEDA